MLGLNDHQAAVAAGARDAEGFKHSPAVREQLAAARRWLTDTTQIRRLDVIEGIIDGIEQARHLGDPGSMIKGWVEISKLLGYAVPDIKTQNITINQMKLKSKFEGMTLEQLLEVSEGRTIDGTATQVQ